jgi:hypothetical protein
MVMVQRLTALAAIVAAMLLLTACERKITRVEVTEGPQTCFSCHSDQNTFLVAAQQQWEHSRHASGTTLNENDGTCKDCHTSEGFVARVTGTMLPNEVENPTTIHCFTCHAPHTDGDFRLRWTAMTTLQDGTTWDLEAGNTCAACHQSRRNVNTYIVAKPGRTSVNNRFGPHHGPQGDMLIGTNGYEFVGYVYEETNHRAIEDGCIVCHKNTTSNNVVGGHAFNMRWDTGTEEIRNTAACSQTPASGACHAVVDDFNEIKIGNTSLQDSVVARTDSLKAILVAANLVDATTGLPKTVSLGADSAGAVYNYVMVMEDRSKGVHNPKYVLGLLNSSIMYMSGSLPQPGPSPAPRLTPRAAHLAMAEAKPRR